MPRTVALIAPALAALTLAVPGIVPESRAADGLAAGIPLPRLNPLRAQAPGADEIELLLLGFADEDRTVEDSEAPQADLAPPPRPPQPRPPATKADLGAVGLRYALKFLDEGDPAAATAAAYVLPNPVDTKIIDWLVGISGRPDVPSSRIADIAARLKDWPGQRLLQIRFEEALVRELPPPQAAIAAMAGRTPETEPATLLLTRAYLAAGRKADAASVIRRYWSEERFGSDAEARLIKEFGSLITASDIKARMDRLLYEEQVAPALKTAKYLDKNEQALASAVAAVVGGKNPGGALASVPAAKQKDPLFIYSKIQHLRRADKLDDAAALMLEAPKDPEAIDGDAWWIERKLISRLLLDRGDARRAYLIAAGHSAESAEEIAEAEFHAGWFALEYNNDPRTAARHFARIEQVSSRPISMARAEYWLGRAADKTGDGRAAEAHYRRAGQHPSTFYGQLALAKLGYTHLPLRRPAADAAAAARFQSHELVQAIDRLEAANRGDRNDIFYRALAEQLSDPAELALLIAKVEKSGNHAFALQLGKIAAWRDLPVDTLAFPTSAIPKSAKIGVVEKPMVYAVARQESAFNPAAVSSAGARGLLQLMPATAQQVARQVGLPYAQSRLTSDPGYNATLGAAYLGKLYSNYGGSYVMTFAAYNAGGTRVRRWIEQYGDPRDPNVDVVNWIERIPFTETRNYVQRVMENLQVYRARLGDPALTIASDLKRGRPI